MKLNLCPGLNKILFIFLVFIFSCRPTTVEKHQTETDKKGEALIKVNKYLLRKDNDLIKSYIKRHDWHMNQTKSGLWYEIYQKGNGKPVENGNIVELKYKTELIDGTLCYSSDSLGNKKFKVGQGGVEAGLEEGVQLLNKGSAARFILLPHLAFGLMGDENKIPPRSIVVYEVELINVK